MTEFVVSWSCPFEAETSEEAAEMAWAAMEDAIKQSGPTSVLVVRGLNDEFFGRFDMAYIPPIEIGKE